MSYNKVHPKFILDYDKSTFRRLRMKYLSESWPEIRDPTRYPTKRLEDAKGTFHWLSQTRSHCEKM